MQGKVKCKNPNGKLNMQVIQDSKLSAVKFNSFDKLERYINELGYTFKVQNCFKEDRSFLYTKKFSKQQAYLRSTFDYLNDNTIEMGTVWTVQQFIRS